MLNKVILIGNLSSDVDLKYSQKGTAYCKFSLATNKLDKEGNNRASFHRITCFNKLAENVSKFCQKGKLVYLEGELNYSSTEVNGEKKYFTDIVANDVKFLSGSKEDRIQPEPAQYQKQDLYTTEDIPF